MSLAMMEKPPSTVFYYNDPDSIGMEFFTVGGNVTIDSMEIYSMKSTWREMDRQRAFPRLLYPKILPSSPDWSFQKAHWILLFASDVLNYRASVENSVDSIRVTSHP